MTLSDGRIDRRVKTGAADKGDIGRIRHMGRRRAQIETLGALVILGNPAAPDERRNRETGCVHQRRLPARPVHRPHVQL
ncbi:hypothetical protein [Sanguibacter sp. 25GB23B1]|uniref:hypothetical protein n=1 Tax=unclassified Sanguibacter TaxID=2645534 RepID=UPI0032AF2DF9